MLTSVVWLLLLSHPCLPCKNASCVHSACLERLLSRLSLDLVCAHQGCAPSPEISHGPKPGNVPWHICFSNKDVI